MIYTALGDSITAGTGATTPALAYPSLLAALLQQSTRRPVSVQVLADAGWTSATLTDAVFENPPGCLQTTDVLSVWIGGDDLANAGLALLHGAPRAVIGKSLRRYAQDMTVLIRGIQSVSRARIVLCTQYNPFPNSPVAVQAISALNAVTMETARKLGAIVAPAHAWFEGRQSKLIAGYRTGRLEDVLAGPPLPVHPNDRGHGVIAMGLRPFLFG